MHVTTDPLPPGAQLIRFRDEVSVANVVVIVEGDAVHVLSWMGTPPTRAMINLLKGIFPRTVKLNWDSGKAPQWF